MRPHQLIVLALALAVAPLVAHGQADGPYGAPPPDLKRHLDRLVAAYPDWIAGYDATHLVMKDGTRFVISDNLTSKSFDTLLEKPDIDDMFYVPYPKGSAPAPPARNVDPGRVRFEPLFVKMYGDCKKRDLAGGLRSIEWLPRHKGGRVSVTTVNGVDRALERVSVELDALPAELVKYAMPSAGTYACRMVAGSNMRSMHAYANAIDLNTRYAAYWRWSGGGKGAPKWQNQMPVEIVRVFEKHGFIWGGHWYHYDTMHFEYRPELLGP